jgi:hypothetical protein
MLEWIMTEVPAPDYTGAPNRMRLRCNMNYKTMTLQPEKESIKVLTECADLQRRKSNDYQHPQSRIRQADYYPSGVKTILEIIQAKVLRAQSVIEAMELDPNYVPNFESVEDSLKDLINYSSFGVAFIRGKVDGQDPERDFLNRRHTA